MNITGIKKASGYTENYPKRSQHRTDLFIDLETGEVWGMYVYGDNTRLQYHKPSIRRLASTKRHLTMSVIRHLAEDALANATT